MHMVHRKIGPKTNVEEKALGIPYSALVMSQQAGQGKVSTVKTVWLQGTERYYSVWVRLDLSLDSSECALLSRWRILIKKTYRKEKEKQIVFILLLSPKEWLEGNEGSCTHWCLGVAVQTHHCWPLSTYFILEKMWFKFLDQRQWWHICHVKHQESTHFPAEYRHAAQSSARKDAEYIWMFHLKLFHILLHVYALCVIIILEKQYLLSVRGA